MISACSSYLPSIKEEMSQLNGRLTTAQKVSLCGLAILSVASVAAGVTIMAFGGVVIPGVIAFSALTGQIMTGVGGTISVGLIVGLVAASLKGHKLHRDDSQKTSPSVSRRSSENKALEEEEKEAESPSVSRRSSVDEGNLGDCIKYEEKESERTCLQNAVSVLGLLGKMTVESSKVLSSAAREKIEEIKGNLNHECKKAITGALEKSWLVFVSVSLNICAFSRYATNVLDKAPLLLFPPSEKSLQKEDIELQPTGCGEDWVVVDEE